MYLQLIDFYSEFSTDESSWNMFFSIISLESSNMTRKSYHHFSMFRVLGLTPYVSLRFLFTTQPDFINQFLKMNMAPKAPTKRYAKKKPLPKPGKVKHFQNHPNETSEVDIWGIGWLGPQGETGGVGRSIKTHLN